MKELEKKLLSIIKEHIGPDEEIALDLLTDLMREMQEHDNNTVTELICSK